MKNNEKINKKIGGKNEKVGERNYESAWIRQNRKEIDSKFTAH